MKTKKKFLLKRIKKNPKFSIITVVKNDQHNISKTIKSIYTQSYKDFEYLIIDGKSTDETLTKILKFKNKINILISENDKGIYYAMNKAIKLTKGKIYINIRTNMYSRQTKRQIYLYRIIKYQAFGNIKF